MSELREPAGAKLICSLFAREKELIDQVFKEMEVRLGRLQQVSPLLPFPKTRHYEKEFGYPLVRRFGVFESLVSQSILPEVKVWCVELERRYGHGGRRLVNVDPGLLTLERLVLATGKNYTHRIYLGKGVFADLTLIFENGSFRALEWTYPDYASQDSIEWWNAVREGLKKELRLQREQERG